MTADTFSTQNLIRIAKRLCLGVLAVWLLVEAGLWVAFRAPTETPVTYRLSNKLPGLKQKVTVTMNLDQQLRGLNWTAGAKEANTVRILCVGGQATFGQLQNAADTWWGQLSTLLQEKLPGVKIEIGTNGANGLMSLMGARWVSTFAQDFQPDVIITNFGAGDVMGQPLQYTYDARAFDALPITKRDRGGFKNFLLKCSQLARWKRASNAKSDGQQMQDVMGGDDFFTEHFAQMRQGFAKVVPIPNPFRVSDADPRNEYQDAIKIIASQAKSVGAKLILTGEPCLCRELMTEEAEALRCTYTPKSPAEGNVAIKLQAHWIEREMRRFQESAAEYATENQLVFVDLNGEVPQDPAHFVTETILTDAGAKKMAELLLPKVLPVIQQVLKK